MIGLIDTGIDPAVVAVQAARTFGTGENPTRHGTALAAIIARLAPAAPLCSAAVFGGGPASAAAVAEALDWLVGEGVGIVNMSLGLTADRPVLAEACARAVAGGVILVASVPAIGPAVYPAAYPGVIRVTGDARCADDEIAWLGGSRADFGACSWPAGCPEDAPSVAGASVAAARVSGRLAALALEHGRDADLPALLAGLARHRGPQRHKVAR